MSSYNLHTGLMITGSNEMNGTIVSAVEVIPFVSGETWTWNTGMTLNVPVSYFVQAYGFNTTLLQGDEFGVTVQFSRASTSNAILPDPINVVANLLAIGRP
jgi:hypothetical protein